MNGRRCSPASPWWSNVDEETGGLAGVTVGEVRAARRAVPASRAREGRQRGLGHQQVEEAGDPGPGEVAGAVAPTALLLPGWDDQSIIGTDELTGRSAGR